MLRTAQSLPLQGLSTLGSDPARYQTEPPACYRASWQLPGRDSHPQATTSLCSDQVTSIDHLQTLGTLRRGVYLAAHARQAQLPAEVTANDGERCRPAV